MQPGHVASASRSVSGTPSGTLRLWSPPGGVVPFEVPRPSSHDETVLLNDWRDAVAALRGIVTPDRDGKASVPN
jgi:hypothetical protein